MILKFRSYVGEGQASYDEGQSSNVISREEILRIRRLGPLDFELGFSNQLKRESREALISVYYMKEAYRRRDWSVMYSSFRHYCIRQMKMSDTDFYRKFALMQTLSEVPEIEEKILDGSLNQATVGRTIQFLKKESRLRSVSNSEKLELFSKFENKTEREVERALAILSPEAAIPDRRRQISEDGFHRQFTSDQALEDKFTRIKEILAHSFQGSPTDCEFFHKLTDIVLNEIDPQIVDARKLAQAEKRREAKSSVKSESAEPAKAKTRRLTKAWGQNVEEKNLCEDQDQVFSQRQDQNPIQPQKIKYTLREKLSAATERMVRIRDGYLCTDIDPITRMRCNSRYALQCDHIFTVADGGSNEPENLRLLCRSPGRR